MNIKKELSFMAVIAPMIFFLMAVFNFSLPMQKFTSWSLFTLIDELFIYAMYIFSLKDYKEIEK